MTNIWDKYFSGHLKVLELLFRSSLSPEVLYRVVRHCEAHNKPLPQWANAALLADLGARERRGRGRPPTRFEVHYERWEAVCELVRRRDELNEMWPASYEERWESVSRFLRGTDAQGSAQAIKDSFEYIEAILRDRVEK